MLAILEDGTKFLDEAEGANVDYVGYYASVQYFRQISRGPREGIKAAYKVSGRN